MDAGERGKRKDGWMKTQKRIVRRVSSLSQAACEFRRPRGVRTKSAPTRGRERETVRKSQGKLEERDANPPATQDIRHIVQLGHGVAGLDDRRAILDTPRGTGFGEL